MVKKRKPYNVYTKEFKLEALKLMEESDKPSSQIALELGIRRNLLYKWKETMIRNFGVRSFHATFHIISRGQTNLK